MAERAYPLVVTALSNEDGGGFIARVPDLPGCLGSGDTPELAVQDVLAAIGEWIDEAMRLNRPVPVPGACVETVRQERKLLFSVLAKQDDLIKKQEKLLDGARAEVERVMAAAKALMHEDTEGSVSGYDMHWTGTFASFATFTKKVALTN